MKSRSINLKYFSANFLINIFTYNTESAKEGSTLLATDTTTLRHTYCQHYMKYHESPSVSPI